MAYFENAAFPSAARTATPAPVIVEVDEGALNVEVLINVTAVTAAPSTTFAIDVPDGAGGWTQVLVSAAVATVSVVRLLLGGDITAAANLAVQGIPARYLRIRPVHGNANSMTYSIVVRGR